jgi:hypothetical protein
MEAFTAARDKSRWDWTLMNMVPEWISADHFDAARRAVEEKSGAPALDALRLEKFDEGLAVQTLHIGSYDAEGPALEDMHNRVIPSRFLTMTGKHHEIYLNDFRRVAADKLRTILRQPVCRDAD